jgi:hypothetical protein
MHIVLGIILANYMDVKKMEKEEYPCRSNHVMPLLREGLQDSGRLRFEGLSREAEKPLLSTNPK